MQITEEEARKKACHRSLVPTVIAGEAAYLTSTCCASDCMAWRWGPKQYREFHLADDRTVTTEPERPPAVPIDWIWQPHDPTEDDGAGWQEPQSSADKRRRGYCGLAGEVRP